MDIKPARNAVTIGAVLYTSFALGIGYIALGLWPGFLFTFGFLGGLIIWLYMPMETTFKRISVPYFITLLPVLPT